MHTQHKAYISYLGIQIKTDEYSRYQATLQVSRLSKHQNKVISGKNLKPFQFLFLRVMKTTEVT